MITVLGQTGKVDYYFFTIDVLFEACILLAREGVTVF
jgi:hypothetical protein